MTTAPIKTWGTFQYTELQAKLWDKGGVLKHTPVLPSKSMMQAVYQRMHYGSWLEQAAVYFQIHWTAWYIVKVQERTAKYTDHEPKLFVLSTAQMDTLFLIYSRSYTILSDTVSFKLEYGKWMLYRKIYWWGNKTL